MNQNSSTAISSFIPAIMLIESIITYFNQLFMCENFPWQIITSIFLGIIIAIVYNLDFAKYINMQSSVPYIGNILTGIILSRGSNYFYDFISKFLNQ